MASEKEELLSLAQNLKKALSHQKEFDRVQTVAPSQKAVSIPAVESTPESSLSEDSQLFTLNLDQLNDLVLSCEKCSLAKSRKKVVFGTGNPQADLMFVGEAPGFDEDAQGLPFVGKAGQLLTKIIEAMGYKREEVYIANVLKCRPPDNRSPEPTEIEQCEPYLLRQVNLVQPKVIVALGTFAVQTLLKTDKKISGLRGLFHDYYGTPLMPTFHPAYLLRSPAKKKEVWDDMKIVMAELKKER